MHLPVIDLPTELAKLKAQDWIKSHRRTETGIGKTIEDLLGIIENPNSLPDCNYNGHDVELKAHRMHSNSMITLFTLEPGTRHLDDVELMEKYGYNDINGRLALKITLSTQQTTPQGLRLRTNTTAGTISIVDTSGYEPWVWTTSDIHLKLHNLCIIYCDSMKRGEDEYFKVEKATLLTGLDDRKFFGLVDSGNVKVDLRMHQKDTGASRNHGTAFRTSSWYRLASCYQNQQAILA